MGSEMGGKERGGSTGEFSLNKWKPLLCFKGKIAKWRHILITSVASWDVYANFQRYVSIGIRGSKTPASVMWKTQAFKHHRQIALMLFQCKERGGSSRKGFTWISLHNLPAVWMPLRPKVSLSTVFPGRRAQLPLCGLSSYETLPALCCCPPPLKFMSSQTALLSMDAPETFELLGFHHQSLWYMVTPRLTFYQTLALLCGFSWCGHPSAQIRAPELWRVKIK